MEFSLVCTAWVKEADEKVLELLMASDRWLSAEELAEQTGLPLHRVEHTLEMLRRQMKMASGRRRLLTEEE